MNICVDFTEFRRMFLPLSVYQEKSRDKEIAAKVNWIFGGEFKLYGYDSPISQHRISIIHLNKSKFRGLNESHSSFSTKVPIKRSLGKIVDGNDIKIDTRPKKSKLRISTDNFTYNIAKQNITQRMEIERTYLPMKQIKAEATTSSDKLKKLVEHAPCGPLQLKIGDDNLKLFAEGHEEKISYDIPNSNVITCSTERVFNYTYDLGMFSRSIKRFPRNTKVIIILNDDLIKLQYKIGNDIGSVNYYQRCR